MGGTDSGVPNGPDVASNDAILDRMVDRMVDRMAHQLRNPLQAIVVNLEVLRVRTSGADPDLWAQLEGYAEGIDQSVRRLDRLLRLLVYAARAPADEFESVDLERMVHDLVGGVALDSEPAPVRLLEGEAPPAVRARPGRLARWLFALLTDARSRSREEIWIDLVPEEGGVRLDVELRLAPDASPIPEAAWQRWADLAEEAGGRARRDNRGEAGLERVSLHMPAG